MKIFGWCIFLVISVRVSAQTSTQYFNRIGGEVTTAAGSYYYSVGKKNVQGYFSDSLKTYFTKTNTLRSVEVRDLTGNRIGDYMSYYETGKLKAVGRYDRKNFRVITTSPDSIEFTLLEFYDSTGRRQVHLGSGFVNGRLDHLKEKGSIVNGVRDSVWTRFYDNGKIMNLESWQGGDLIDGMFYDHDGVERYYQQETVLPEPVDGMNKFYEAIAEKVVYPPEAERRGIAGRIVVELTIASDGLINNIRIVEGLGFGCDEEVIKALKSSSAWKPAVLRGQPVIYRTNIQFLFKLS